MSASPPATGATLVLDMGKTVSKVSCWADDGTLIDRRTRNNVRIGTVNYEALDATNNESWLVDTLRAMAQQAQVHSIIPVAHGAAAAIIRDGRLVVSPFDYESTIPAHIRDEYALLRDPFALTGSPLLPNGLNLGAQLYYLQSLQQDLFAAGTHILPWAQYWSWLLCGTPSSEVTSLGCHTDLWQPMASSPSALCVSQGWATHLPALRQANEVLGTVRREWATRTGLSDSARVYCGLHDSNAALIAARAHPQIAEQEATILSTGTWFVGMRNVRSPDAIAIGALDEGRDCLVNVDAQGHAVPSCRFMGGREIELLTESLPHRIDDAALQKALLSAVYRVVRQGSRVLPTFAAGCGPYPEHPGRWHEPPDDPEERCAAVCLYAALMTDAALELIGARHTLLIEGRFARCELFVRALASLRPGDKVYVTTAAGDASFGALRLVRPDVRPPGQLREVAPLPDDLNDYRRRWREQAEGPGH